MEKGSRRIKTGNKNDQPYSMNTEIWFSDFFWPFFSNYSYEEIMSLTLDVLINNFSTNDLSSQIDIPEKLLDSFGNECRKAGLINEAGIFDNPYKLVHFFCS